MKFFTALATVAFTAVGALASNVIDLTPENFDSVVGQGKPALVEFFAPWCGHCKKLAPIYEELADAFADKKDKVVIAKVDADGVGRELGQRYGVSGFPTLKWFGPNGGDPETYSGGRELLDLAEYVTKQSGVKSNIRPPPPPAYQILDTHTFDEVALNKDKNVLVAFTAPWCGHCKRLKPIYEEVAKDFAPESDCVVANVDADAAANRPLAMKYEIGSFPTIKFFPKNNKDEPEDYDGERTEEAIVAYLNEKCGKKRVPGGGLSDDAGRFPEFDALAAKFFSATGDDRQTVLKEAEVLLKKAGEGAKHYLKVMEKVVNGSEEYIAKETKRLTSILQKRTLSAQKLDEIKIKSNILSAFKKTEEAEESAEEAVKRDSAEL